MNKLLHHLIMYHEIHKQHREGLKVSQISRKLGLDRRTIRRYLAMNEKEYQDFMNNNISRGKMLIPYEEYIKTRLEACPEASAAQVHDWLKESNENFIDVSAKTVFNYVLFVRDKYGIPKPFGHRDYTRVEELPYGKQSQADFGEYNMTTDDGKRKKIYFFSLVLSRSRYKYLCFSERPYTTLLAIAAHESAFHYQEGITQEIVYDQDTLLLVKENIGDLILTDAFRRYAEYRGIKLHFCRKSDPESKGKIENVIRYIKHNFLRGRVFVDIDTLNAQAIAWLERTANTKVHATTLRVPQDEWIIEKGYLRPVLDSFKAESVLDDHLVIKDNVISFKGNFYRVPPGTYKGTGTIVRTEVTDDNHLFIYDVDKNKIASHKIYSGKGKTIGGKNYMRDFSSGIDQLINDLSSQFNDPERTREYLQQIRQDKPRYIRDQLQHIKKLTGSFDMKVMNLALDFCIKNRIYRATDLGSVAKKLHIQRNQDETIKQPLKIETINRTAHKIIPNKSNISDYQSLMN
jgi:transposase